MKVKMLKSSVASGKKLAAGKTYDVSDADARVLIAYGKAVDAADKEAVAEANKVAKAEAEANKQAEPEATK